MHDFSLKQKATFLLGDEIVWFWLATFTSACKANQFLKMDMNRSCIVLLGLSEAKRRLRFLAYIFETPF